MGLENSNRIFADLTRRKTRRLSHLANEEVNEFRDIVATLGKTWHTQRHDVQAMKEILAKAAFFNLAFDVAACGGDNARIDRDLLRAAHTDEFLFNKHAQDLALRFHRHVGDFVDVERASMGFFERANFARAACAVFRAEKLFFHAIGCHGSRIEHHERSVCPM